jgi:hypothetical protein
MICKFINNKVEQGLTEHHDNIHSPILTPKNNNSKRKRVTTPSPGKVTFSPPPKTHATPKSHRRKKKSKSSRSPGLIATHLQFDSPDTIQTQKSLDTSIDTPSSTTLNHGMQLVTQFLSNQPQYTRPLYDQLKLQYDTLEKQYHQLKKDHCDLQTEYFKTVNDHQIVTEQYNNERRYLILENNKLESTIHRNCYEYEQHESRYKSFILEMMLHQQSRVLSLLWKKLLIFNALGIGE